MREDNEITMGGIYFDTRELRYKRWDNGIQSTVQPQRISITEIGMTEEKPELNYTNEVIYKIVAENGRTVSATATTSWNSLKNFKLHLVGTARSEWYRKEIKRTRNESIKENYVDCMVVQIDIDHKRDIISMIKTPIDLWVDKNMEDKE